MKSRILVALIGVPLLYLAVWAPWNDALALAVVVSIALGMASLELSQMLRPLAPFVPATLVPVALAPLLTWRLAEVGLVLAILTAFPLVLAFHGLSVERREPLGAIAATLAPVVWLAPAGAVLVILRQAEQGFGLVLVLIAAVFLNDTAAFFTGRALGRHKLAPRLSPNKSIEGFIGGVAVGTFTMWFGGHYMVRGEGESLVLGGWEALAIGVAVALATPVGDLFESLVKRAASVKDSGRLLGDHGGVLDRVDALVMALPVMYVGAFLAGVL